MRLLWAFIAFSLLASGCSRSYYGGPKESGDDRAFAELSAREAARVYLVDGQTCEARSIVLRDTSTSWIDVKSGEWIEVPTRNVHKIAFGDAAADRAVLGFVAGECMGALLGWCWGRARGGGEADEWLSHWEGAALGASLAVVPAALMIGIARGWGAEAGREFYPHVAGQRESPARAESRAQGRARARRTAY